MNKKNYLYLFTLVCIIGAFFMTYINGLTPSETKEKLTNYLSQLVSMNTLSSDKSANQKALDWVEENLKSLPLQFHHHEYDGFHNLVITTGAIKKTKVMLVAHIDVVAGKESLFQP